MRKHFSVPLLARFFASALMLLTGSLLCGGDLKLPAIFGTQKVLQQDEALPVWAGPISAEGVAKPIAGPTTPKHLSTIEWACPWSLFEPMFPE
ncbi:hypothetical protein [Coraliomargarita parva]|uniref:hypothetical protein n=1 Tax=Coraliomargarita parva TaxID=3014050 RepID=UPI0022B54C80|nr:hypothetical protein [Coraliomargarita parva]